MNKLICYELNEVPWRVVDRYVEQRPGSHFASLLERSAQFTSHCNDYGELQPWSTWPTLHRGVSNEVHEINFLNQDLSPAVEWPPVWEILNDAAITTGIFGSLQSYPPSNHPKMLFHIPDTFASGATTKPKRYEPFQSFNLKQTGENKASASSVSVIDIPKAVGLVRTGIKTGTYAKIARHLLSEQKNPLYKSRRSLLQPELALDVLFSCLKDAQPQFVTFFSNHVAGIMHRYWKYTFPEDFDHTLADTTAEAFHKGSLLKAMDQFDEHLGKLIPFARENGYDLLIMSSMGQEAIDRGEYVEELIVDDFNALISGIGCDYEVTMNLAMQPDIAFVFKSAAVLSDCRDRLNTVTDSVGQPLFEQRYPEVGNTLNMATRSSKTLVSDKIVRFDGNDCTLESLGLSLLNRDQGTGYHQPEGILVWEGFDNVATTRELIDTRRILPTLLEYFNVPKRDYMQPALELRKDVAAA